MSSSPTRLLQETVLGEFVEEHLQKSVTAVGELPSGVSQKQRPEFQQFLVEMRHRRLALGARAVDDWPAFHRGIGAAPRDANGANGVQTVGVSSNSQDWSDLLVWIEQGR